MDIIEHAGASRSARKHAQHREMTGMTRGDMRRQKKAAAILVASQDFRTPHVGYSLPDPYVPAKNAPRPETRASRVSTQDAPDFAPQCQECSGTTCEPRLHGIASRYLPSTRSDRRYQEEDTRVHPLELVSHECDEPLETLRTKVSTTGRILSHGEKIAARIDHAKNPQPRFFVAR